MNAAEIVAALDRARFNESSEDALQRGVAEVFARAGVAFEREFRLSPRERIDFLCAGGVGIECKIGGTLTSLIRQLHRYAGHERIESLVVVSTRLAHARVPAEVRGKPVHVVATMGGIS